MNPFLLSLGVSFGINALFFVIAALNKTDVVTDLSYSLSFALVAAFLAATDREAGLTVLLPSLLTIIWAFRLGAYLFGRIRRIKVDHRFDGMREKPLSFAKFWILQAAAVFVILLPLSAASASADEGLRFGFWESVGGLLWCIGFIVETVADLQKARFKKGGGSGFISSGLWSWSRHPNYFGEALLWWGIFVMVIPTLSGALWLAILGPLGITALLLFVSGIPPLEKSADAKFGPDPAYQAYKRSTPIFIPRPPRR